MNDSSINKKDSFLKESLERLRRNDPTLTILNLNHVSLGGRCSIRSSSNGSHDNKNGYCHLLATALQHNTHLIVLFLNNTDLVGSSVAFRELAQSIGRHPTLAYCYMSYNPRLGNAGAAVLAQQALLVRPALPLLSVSTTTPTSKSNVGRREEGACHRQHHQHHHHHHHQCLRVLKLSNNNIGRAGARALAEALKLQQPGQQRQRRHGHAVDGNDDDNDAGCSRSSWGLQSLVLQNNCIYPHGLVELANALRSNTSLVSLNVRHNPVAPDAMPMVQQGFVNSLRHDNRTLSELMLYPDKKNDQEEDSNSSRSSCSSNSNVGRELQYYLDWNRLGRQYFGDATIPATAWTRVLANAASVSARQSPSSSSFLQQQEHHQHHNVDQSSHALPALPPPRSTPPSLLFTTLRARPDLLQQQQEQHE